MSLSSQARNDRAGGAQFVYTMLQTGQLVIADTCQNVIRAIESRVHDKKEPLKVEKVVGDPVKRRGRSTVRQLGRTPTAVR
jgi:hypothetical protein